MEIVVVDGYHLNPGDLSWKGIKSFGNLTVYDSSSPDQLYERTKNANIVLTNKAVFDGPLLEKLSHLKYLCVTATGYNNVDVDKARALNIPVSNVSGYSTDSVAQHVFAFILAVLNKVQIYSEQIRAGEWSRRNDWSYTLEPIRNLSGMTIGIVGFGKIGQQVARLAKKFNMNVIALNKHPERSKMDGVSFLSFDEVMSKSDVVTLHIPLNPGTHEIINQQSIGKMRSEAILINTGRGQLINEGDLYKALVNKKIKAACLDVLVDEPPKKENRLLTLDNCYITPHVAWSGVQARKRMMELLIENLKGFQSGNLINVVNF